MVEKQKFAERWPVRHYTVNLKSFSIQCATLCMADGIIGWDVSSQERNARSIGTARISFVLAGAGPFVITSENGSVINRSNQPLDGSGASNPPVAAAGGAAVISQAYNEGRDARLRYEDWFTKLPDGPFKDGVLFWVSNRSKTPTPMCFSSANAQNSDWLSGCGAAQRFFVTVDVRRKSDKDYWFGWNSL